LLKNLIFRIGSILSSIRLTPLSFSMTLSVAMHLFVVFGIVLVMPKSFGKPNLAPQLNVVLVNAKSRSKPVKADSLAQHNLDGGGNTEEDRRAKSPLPTIRDDDRFTPEQRAKNVTALEEESKRMMTQLKNDRSVPPPTPKKEKSKSDSSGDDLVQKALEIARLEAEISKNWEAYQKLPRRKFIGARTSEYRFAQYIEDWRIKVERIGNLNYPQRARELGIHGSLQVSVSIRADGSVENVEVSRSSHHRLLDAAALRIVKLAAPFSPLPPSITKDTDILTITRTWTFTSSDRMESE